MRSPKGRAHTAPLGAGKPEGPEGASAYCTFRCWKGIGIYYVVAPSGQEQYMPKGAPSGQRAKRAPKGARRGISFASRCPFGARAKRDAKPNRRGAKQVSALPISWLCVVYWLRQFMRGAHTAPLGAGEQRGMPFQHLKVQYALAPSGPSGVIY